MELFSTLSRRQKRWLLRICGAALLFAAGLLLEGFAHHVHTEQEQCQTAQQGDDFKDICAHIYLSFFS